MFNVFVGVHAQILYHLTCDLLDLSTDFTGLTWVSPQWLGTCLVLQSLWLECVTYSHQFLDLRLATSFCAWSRWAASKTTGTRWHSKTMQGQRSVPALWLLCPPNLTGRFGNVLQCGPTFLEKHFLQLHLSCHLNVHIGLSRQTLVRWCDDPILPLSRT